MLATATNVQVRREEYFSHTPVPQSNTIPQQLQINQPCVYLGQAFASQDVGCGYFLIKGWELLRFFKTSIHTASLALTYNYILVTSLTIAISTQKTVPST